MLEPMTHALNGLKTALLGGFGLLFFLPPLCLASGGGDAATRVEAHISIIAVGPVPPRRYASEEKSVEDAALLSPLPGTVPPARLYHRVLATGSGSEPSDDRSSGNTSPGAREKRPGKERWQSFTVAFNRGGRRFTATAGKPVHLFMKKQSANGGVIYEKYCQLPALKPGSEVVVFLTARSSGVRSWLGRINVSVLDVACQTMINKGILLKNFSHRPIRCSVAEGKALVLLPGSRRSHELNRKRRYYRLYAETKSRQAIINTSLPVSTESITLLVFYSSGQNHNAGEGISVFRATVKRGP